MNARLTLPSENKLLDNIQTVQNISTHSCRMRNW